MPEMSHSLAHAILSCLFLHSLNFPDIVDKPLESNHAQCSDARYSDKVNVSLLYKNYDISNDLYIFTRLATYACNYMDIISIVPVDTMHILFFIGMVVYEAKSCSVQIA